MSEQRLRGRERPLQGGGQVVLGLRGHGAQRPRLLRTAGVAEQGLESLMLKGIRVGSWAEQLLDYISR